MKTFRLANHKYAQCEVLFDEKDKTIALRSYNTIVIIARPLLDNTLVYTLECTGTYSATTRKHIGYFLKEYFPNLSYYDMKKIAGTDDLMQSTLITRTQLF